MCLFSEMLASCCVSVAHGVFSAKIAYFYPIFDTFSCFSLKNATVLQVISKFFVPPTSFSSNLHLLHAKNRVAPSSCQTQVFEVICTFFVLNTNTLSDLQLLPADPKISKWFVPFFEVVTIFLSVLNYFQVSSVICISVKSTASILNGILPTEALPHL